MSLRNSSRRACPASGRKVAGKWWSRGQAGAARIQCPVCRREQIVRAVGKGRAYQTVDGVLLVHARAAA